MGDNSTEQVPFVRGVTALIAVAGTVILSLAAACPLIHKSVCPEEADVPHHHCVITAFAAGQVLPVEVCDQLPHWPSGEFSPVVPEPLQAISCPDYLRSPGRDPPVRGFA